MSETNRRQNKKDAHSNFKEQEKPIFFSPTVLQEQNKILAGKLQLEMEQNKILAQKSKNYQREAGEL